MNELELTQKILDYIKIWYKAEYIGYIKVEKTDTEYRCILGIPSYMIPTSFATNAETDEEFLEYVYKELRVKNYIRRDVYQVVRTPDTKEE